MDQFILETALYVCVCVCVIWYHNESRSHGCARFWFNGSQTFGVQHRCDDGQSSSYGFGSGQRDSPRFTEVTCLKYVYDVAGATP